MGITVEGDLNLILRADNVKINNNHILYLSKVNN